MVLSFWSAVFFRRLCTDYYLRDLRCRDEVSVIFKTIQIRRHWIECLAFGVNKPWSRIKQCVLGDELGTENTANLWKTCIELCYITMSTICIVVYYRLSRIFLKHSISRTYNHAGNYAGSETRIQGPIPQKIDCFVQFLVQEKGLFSWITEELVSLFCVNLIFLLANW